MNDAAPPFASPDPTAQDSDPTDSSSWKARLSLGFVRVGERTVLAEREHLGPLRVQRPFYPEGERSCHVYVLHPPGGVVGGDRLELDARAGKGAQALLTTPAATKLYRSAGARARVRQTLRVEAGAALEWLPQETIAFSGALAELHTRVELRGDARFVGWEISCLGRPASGERFERGELAQRIELLRDDKLLYSERGRYLGGSPLLRAAWGLADQPVLGTLLCAGADLTAHLPTLRAALDEVSASHAKHESERAETRAAPPPSRQGRVGPCASVSCMGELLVARYLGPSTEVARACFTRLWELARPLLLARAANAPRIWLT